MTPEPIVVIGIGQDGCEGLGTGAQAYLAHADILAGGKRHLAYFPAFAGKKVVLEGPPSDWILKLKSYDRQQKIVVLATGDPLFYGIGRLLLEAFPKDELVFLPQVSSLALAFARLKETWNDACVVSLHGRPMEMLLPALKRREPKIALFTDEINHPVAIARLLCEQGLGKDYGLWVCENLDGDRERITHWSPPEMRNEEFAPLNVVVLLAKADNRRAYAAPLADTTYPAPLADMPYAAPLADTPLLGLPESAFQHRGELITKREVRLQALCYLELHSGDELWDIGAGSGSVSIEAARLSPELTVHAIEKDQASLVHLRHNLEHFHLRNIHMIVAEAPECFTELPDPDAIFLGGNGGRLSAILEQALRRLKPGGRLVLSCITLETLSQSWHWLSEHQWQPQVTSMQIAHSRSLGSLHCLEPEKPIFLLWVKKP